MNNGATWSPINKEPVTGSNYEWTVPIPLINQEHCRLKVVAYNVLDGKLGSDISEACFAIELLKVTYPDSTEILVSGSSVTITWTLNATKRPVTKTILYYTKDVGMTWSVIKTFNGDPDSKVFEWILPTVSKPKPKCKIKVVLKDANGNNLGSDISDAYFSIKPSQ